MRLLRDEVEFGEEGAVFVYAGVFGGEEFVAVENGIRPGEKAERLAFAGKAGATGAEADFRFGQRDARDGDEADEREDIHGRLIFERGARHGHEAIDRHALGRGGEIGEDFEHFQPVEFRFAHADDAAAAHIHSGLLHGGDGVHAILKSVRGDDVRIVLRRSVDVVMHIEPVPIFANALMVTFGAIITP